MVLGYIAIETSDLTRILNCYHNVIKGKARSKMKMILSKDFEARNFIVKLFLSFDVMFFCYLLLKVPFLLPVFQILKSGVCISNFEMLSRKNRTCYPIVVPWFN